MMGGGHLTKQAGTVAGAEALTREMAETFREVLVNDYENAQNTYELALKSGVPKELARLVLPVGRYTRMRATANLRNWLAFLTLRDHKAAQWEIQQYAAAVSKFVAEAFPRTHALWAEGQR
jgi:thymidylate synthase (FAD)